MNGYYYYYYHHLIHHLNLQMNLMEKQFHFHYNNMIIRLQFHFHYNNMRIGAPVVTVSALSPIVVLQPDHGCSQHARADAPMS